MIVLKSPREIEEMRRVNRIVAEVLDLLRARARPGVSTGELNELVEAEVARRKVTAAFKGVKNPQGRPYPASVCTSVNDEVVHGIPRADRFLKEGDLLSVDFGVAVGGMYGDAAVSIAVGEARPRVAALIRAAEEALEAGISEARPGRRLGDVSAAIQQVVEGAGFTVVREFVGHGIGRSLHEDPQLPNYGKGGTGIRLRAGMVLAIEPMINDGAGGVIVDSDGWTARTKDGSLSAHVEHTVAVTENGPDVLSRL
ncbi:MAG: type I methionyl aminopeptidase [Deltaproteobacteria bacterium]|nr:type I methionyl aminopeptidase [Deltaproteobacteria bacterium]